jgi:hypothetical protein
MKSDFLKKVLKKSETGFCTVFWSSCTSRAAVNDISCAHRLRLCHALLSKLTEVKQTS